MMKLHQCLFSIAILLVATACGSRANNTKPANGAGELAGCGEFCADSAECATGQCINDVCDCGGGPGPNPNGTACTDASACGPNEYCHFPSTSPWIPGTE